MSSTLIFVICVAVVGLYAILTYNKLVAGRNAYGNSFSQIDVQLQRRYELIPNLVEVAKTYLKHEHETLTAVIEARNTAKKCCKEAAASPTDKGVISKLAGAERTLGSAMGSLNMVMEDYPDLKADERIAELHAELASTENRVTFARQAYSDTAMMYNTDCEQFPAVIIARLFGFNEADMFEVESQAIRQPVRVSFN